MKKRADYTPPPLPSSLYIGGSTLGWVDVGTRAKVRWIYVGSLVKAWEIVIKVS
jgi:hypothetical protein